MHAAAFLPTASGGDSIGAAAMSALHPPRIELPVDLDAHIARLPPNASCKGFFFTDILNRLKRAHPGNDPYALAGIPEKRYVPFFEYPYADILRLCFNGAKHLYPNLSIGAGLRELGAHAYDTLLKSPAGRVIAGVFGLDIEQVLPNGIKAYALAINFGKVTIEMLGNRTARYEFRDLPGLLETYQVGVIEGAVRHCGCEPDVRVSMSDIANASMELRWR
jgi:uncharacterized protein (TIGR02265 family)